jgi:hypothetical protein
MRALYSPLNNQLCPLSRLTDPYLPDFPILSASREDTTFDIDGDPLLEAGLAGVDQMGTIWARVVVRKLARDTVRSAAKACILHRIDIDFSLLRCRSHPSQVFPAT